MVLRTVTVQRTCPLRGQGWSRDWQQMSEFSRSNSSFLSGVRAVQVKYIVGYNIPHADRMQDIVYNLIVRWEQFRWLEAAMGLSFIALLLAIKNAPRLHKCAPRPNRTSCCC